MGWICLLSSTLGPRKGFFETTAYTSGLEEILKIFFVLNLKHLLFWGTYTQPLITSVNNCVEISLSTYQTVVGKFIVCLRKSVLLRVLKIHINIILVFFMDCYVFMGN